ncbi:MAG: AAA family ATPase, partial [Acidianus infernus]|nr:AAA family ATPase [Acidianus infernus]
MSTPIKLKVSEARQRDVGRKIARLSENLMTKLKIDAGDYLEIIGPSGSSLVQAMPAYDINDDEIRIDGYIRKAIGASIGDEVEIRKATVNKATKIVLA